MTEAREWSLDGLRADNPLAFLAALGTLRVAASTRGPDGSDGVAMRWEAGGDGWTPVLRVPAEAGADADCLCETLHGQMRRSSCHSAFAIADDLTLSPAQFRAAARAAAALAAPPGADRDFADFIAAFGCESIEARENGKPSGKVADTAFRTMSGAGHQHFLGFMRKLAEDCTPAHLKRALFQPWRYDDPVESHAMRWDPLDDVRYALRWRDSSGDPERKRGGTMWGANRLAIEALPLLPTVPLARAQLGTVGFTITRADGASWTWPVWDAWCSVDMVRSLLALETLQDPVPARAPLVRRGVVEVFRCQRIRQGKYRNLTPARSV